MENEENEENEQNFKCMCCDFKCSYLSDWNRHITTRKHIVSANGNNLEIKLGKKNETIGIHQCTSCNKIYKSLSGLWKHNKKCVNTKNISLEKESEIKMLTELVKRCR